MMTDKHKERMREDQDKRQAAAKSSVRRNLLLGALAVIMASVALAGSHRLLTAKEDTPVIAEPPTVNSTAGDMGGWSTADSSPWELILVNRSALLPQTFTVDLQKVDGQRVDARITQALSDMLAAAKNEEIDLLMVSSYRTVSKQRELYEREVEGNMGQGYSEAESIQMAERYQQKPGASEHHTGLAVDIVTPAYQSLDSGYANTLAGQWLAANCTEYGFILRYPEDKAEKTGIMYEPWHFRYVGIKNAQKMREDNLCLEEYVADMPQ